jgi:hypothetical protein
MRPVIVIRLRQADGGREVELTTDSDRKIKAKQHAANVKEDVLRFGDTPAVEVALDRIRRNADLKTAVECILTRLAAHLTKKSLIEAVAQMSGLPLRIPVEPESVSRPRPTKYRAPALAVAG